MAKGPGYASEGFLKMVLFTLSSLEDKREADWQGASQGAPDKSGRRLGLTDKIQNTQIIFLV